MKAKTFKTLGASDLMLQVLIQAYLENILVIDVFSPPFELATKLRLRTILNREREQMRNLWGLSPKGFYADINSLGCVLEISVTAPSIDSPETEESRNRLESVYPCLMIYFDKLLKIGESYRTLGELPDLSKARTSDFGTYHDPIWQHFPSICSFHKFRLELRFPEFQEFKKFWLRFTELQKPGFLESSMARFVMSANMAGDVGKDLYRFVDYVTSMEALLLESSVEMSYKLALRMSALVGGPADDRQNVYEFMREAYDLRSGLVHGSAPEAIRIRRGGTDSPVRFEEAIGRLHSYCGQCIRRMIDLIDVMMREDPDFRGMSDERKKKRITNLLDLSCVRTDLSDALETFLLGQEDGKSLIAYYRRALQTSFYGDLLEERNRQQERSYGHARKAIEERTDMGDEEKKKLIAAVSELERGLSDGSVTSGSLDKLKHYLSKFDWLWPNMPTGARHILRE